MKRFLLILGMLVVFILQVVLSYFIMDKLFNSEATARSMDGQETVEESEVEGGSEEKGEKSAVDYEFGATYNIEDLILNPRGGRRIFKISLALEYDPEIPEIGTELAAKDLFIRDFLLEYLSKIHSDTLGDIQYRGALRDSLAKNLSNFLAEGYVDRVLFVDFIRQ